MDLLRLGCALFAMAGVTFSNSAHAEVTRIEIVSRADILGGNSFGTVGAYEKIIGKVYFSIDPTHPRNVAIVDVDKASRDAAGHVTFSADLYVIAPKDVTRGNGVALFDVLNRGRKNIIQQFNRASQVPDPTNEPISATASSCARATPLYGSDGSSIYRVAAGLWRSTQHRRSNKGNPSPVGSRQYSRRTPPTRPTHLMTWGAMPIPHAIRQLILQAPATRSPCVTGFSVRRGPFRASSGSLGG
jgi:hypothetical protein